MNHRIFFVISLLLVNCLFSEKILNNGVNRHRPKAETNILPVWSLFVSHNQVRTFDITFGPSIFLRNGESSFGFSGTLWYARPLFREPIAADFLAPGLSIFTEIPFVSDALDAGKGLAVGAKIQVSIFNWRSLMGMVFFPKIILYSGFSYIPFSAQPNFQFGFSFFPPFFPLLGISIGGEKGNLIKDPASKINLVVSFDFRLGFIHCEDDGVP